MNWLDMHFDVLALLAKPSCPLASLAAKVGRIDL